MQYPESLASNYNPALLGEFQSHSGLASFLRHGAILLGLTLFLFGMLPEDVFIPGSPHFIWVMGFIGIWRYGWKAIHISRANIYKSLVYPRRAKIAAELNLRPSHLFAVVTSYRIDSEMLVANYGSLLNNCKELGVPATIVACITDQSDVELLERLLMRCNMSDLIKVVPIPQRGLGKRDAMAQALRYIQQQEPDKNAVVLLMDGDGVLPSETLVKSCQFLQAFDDLGAVTIDNEPLVKGNDVTREWYRLRMAQRHLYMCSVSLSGRLLVLTGRYSLFRAPIAASQGFIDAVEHDFFNHWRLGKVKMLTGDDKSTWYHVLTQGWSMAYLPDVKMQPVEELPGGGFFPASIKLMKRWYGNMLRNNGRAVALGPGKTGAFLWTCLLDQRVSMWTSLLGPAFVLIAIIGGHSQFAFIFLFWVALSRTAYASLLSAFSGRRHTIHPFLLFYDQVVGSIVKIVMSFYMYRQKWTRQKVQAAASTIQWHERINGALSLFYLIAAATAFLLLVMVMNHFVAVPDRVTLGNFYN